jgi:hypothetical protein
VKLRPWIPALALAVLLALPDTAYACAVCFDPRAENRFAFLATTVFLTLFPLSLVGGAGVWLRKRARELHEAPPADGDTDTRQG